MPNSVIEKQCILKFLGPYHPIETRGTFRFKAPELKNPGLYLFTFEYECGYIIWFDGFSTKNVADRLNAHTKNIMRGAYSILDVRAANSGKRIEIWKGFYFTKDERKQKAFIQQREVLTPVISSMIQCLRIFYAPLDESRRVLSRIEAAIMHNLYNSSGVTSDFPDKGMHLEPIWPEETAFKVIMENEPILHGLPMEFTA